MDEEETTVWKNGTKLLKSICHRLFFKEDDAVRHRNRIMSLWDDTPTTLTAFGPLSSEVEQTGSLLSRLWKRNKDDSASSSQISSREASVERQGSMSRRKSSASGDSNTTVKTDTVADTESSVHDVGTPEDMFDSVRGVDRTLSSVLTRLSNILERRTTTPQAYKDSDFKQYWMPDSSCKECYDCGDKFTTFRRRHHCRICGQIFCSRCCNQELPGKIIGYKGGIRVCTYCGKVALSALQTEPSGDVQLEKEDLRLSVESDSGSQMGRSFWGTAKGKMRSRLSVNCSSSSLDQMAPFDLTPQTEYLSIEHLDMDRKFLEDSVQLREMWKLVSDPEKGVETQSHRIRLRTYHKCIVGNKLIDWLLKNDRAAQRLQAVAIGQAFIDAGYLEPAGGHPYMFKDDFTLYKPSETSPMDQPDVEIVGDSSQAMESTEPEWLQMIDTDEETESISEEQSERNDNMMVSSHTNDEENIDFEPLPRQDNHTAGTQDDIITDSIFTSSQTITAGKMVSSPRGWRNVEYLKEDNEEKLAFVTLRTIHEEHLTALVSQMLYEEGLSNSWGKIILSTAERVSKYVHPDVKNDGDDMDIRKYIKYKKIPGGTKEQTCLVHGLVFTKNVAHKKMAHQLTNPSILLLKGAIEYQRVESKFSSLEPQILQEDEFLKKNVTKISSLKPKPDIVIVEKSVSRLAQNFLLQEGITLIYNVKLAVMERLERFTQAAIVNSIDGIVSGPITLGFCHNFKARYFSLPSGQNKTMLCFDGCATHLGCTVMLRGGSSSELKQIKKILRHIIYASYNSLLEISLCMDEFAMPPVSSDGFGPGKEDYGVLTDSSDSSPSCVEDIVSGMTASSSDSSGIVGTQEVGVSNTILGRNKETRDELTYQSNSVVKSDNKPSNSDAEFSSSKKTENKKDSETKTSEDRKASSERFPQMVSLPSGSSADEVMRHETGSESTAAEEGFVDVIANLDDDIDKNLRRISADADSSLIKPQTDDTERKNMNESSDELNKRKNKINSLNVPVKDDSRSAGRTTPTLSIITDQTDPLHNHDESYSVDINSPLNFEAEQEKRYKKIKQLLGEVILSVSPFVQHDVPYLESKAGSNCCLRQYFPEEVYWSCRLDPHSFEQKRAKKFHRGEHPVKPPMCWTNIEVVEAHPLILCQLTELNNKITQSMIADFRARGGRIVIKSPSNDSLNERITDWSINNDPIHKPKDSALQGNTRKDRKRDCLEFVRHQRLAVLLSSHSEKSANHPFPCLPPQVVPMEFYGNQDVTLGAFLEKFCFRESYSCQPYTCPSEACDVPMLDHVRRIVHNNGAIYISLRRLKNCVPGGESAIMMWNWCRKCRQATPLVPMSMDTWHISFAKYLELHFYGNGFTRRMKSESCNHSLHQSFSQYFGHRNIVATFKYYSITKLEVALPKSLINLEKGVQRAHLSRLKEEIKHQTNKGTEMYSSVLEYVVKVNCEVQNEALNRLISDYLCMIQNEKSKLHEMARIVRERLNLLQGDLSLWGSEQERTESIHQFYYMQDDIMKVKRFLADSVSNWGHRLQELMSQHKKYKQMAQTKKEKEMASFADDSYSRFASSVPQAQLTESSDSTLEGTSSGTSRFIGAKGNSDPMPIVEAKDVSSIITESPVFSHEVGFTSANDIVVHECYDVKQDYAMSPDVTNSMDLSPGLAAGSSTTETDAMVSRSEGAQRELRRSSIALKEGEDDDTEKHRITSGKHSAKSSISSSSIKSTGSYDDLLEGQQSFTQSTDTRISGLKKTLTNFLSGSGLPSLNLPFDFSEHHILPTCYRVPVSVYDQEPSSIIAYALSCHDYHQKLQEIQTSMMSRDHPGQSLGSKGNKSVDPESLSSDKEGLRKAGSGMLSFLRGNNSSKGETTPVMQQKTQDQSMDSVKYTPKLDSDSIEIDEDRFSVGSLSIGSGDVEKLKNSKQTSPHLELQFSDNTARFYCKVYFAQEFHRIRSLIFPAGEDMYIRSLSRCKVWEAKGGKSGMTFCKTDDDRFLLKQMSSIEVETFEKFGPEYFQHISKSVHDQKPTALAKIVGVYRIGFRNTHTNGTLKHDVLVMENLFYNKKISQTFDLKGSMRNRLVNTSGKREDEIVLLDENLLKLSVESPLYIYPHSRTVLTAAIRRDSEFLSTNMVMDYSLLVGLDDSKKELVVGIIDYIRTFTWDKKLETFIKSTGGKMPTVVSPEIYKTRFLEAMGRYFLPVPDQWIGLGKDMDL